MPKTLLAILLLASCGDNLPDPGPDARPVPRCADIPGCDADHLTCTPDGACECRPELAPSSNPIACEA